MTSPATIAVQNEAPVVRTNLAEELRVAWAAFAEATSKKSIFNAEIADTNRGVESTTTALSKIDPKSIENRTDATESKRRALRALRSKLEGLRAHGPGISEEFRDSEAALHRVRQQIAQNPEYSAAIAEQRRIIAEGAKVAEELWSGPLSNLAATVKRFEEIADREIEFERVTNTQLRDLGLPEVRAQLTNRRHVLPPLIVHMGLAEMEANCSEAIRQLRQYQGGIPAV